MTRHAAMELAHAMAWPPEIAFLVQHGVDPQLIHTMSLRARQLAAPPERVAVMDGFMTARAYWSALARELDVPFLDAAELARDMSHEHVRIPETFTTGIAVLNEQGAGANERANRRFVMAPEGAMISQLLASGPGFRARIALTSPQVLQACVRHAAQGAIAYQAAHALPLTRPEFSALGKSSRWQVMMAGLVVLVLSFFGTLEPVTTLVVSGLVLGPMFLALATVRMAAIFEPDARLPDKAGAETDDAALPVYTVLVPLYRELAVLPQLVAALCALDYPAAKLDVKILVEADDAPMQEALHAIALPPFITVLIVPRGQPRTKPRALNAGLLEARGSLLTIYDAEDVPEPGQLRLAAAILTRSPRRMACLQARLAIDNAGDNLLTRAFALEYAGLFDVINPGLVRSGLPFLLGGTSNHFRTDVLRQIGGWDAWNVTEDADLAIRLVRAGFRIGDCPSTTWEEAPSTLGGWMRQRRRWMKGFMQSSATHSRQPLRLLREVGALKCAALASLCLGTVLSAMFYPLFWVMTGMALRQGDVLAPVGLAQVAATSLALTLFAAGLLAMFGPPFVGLVRRRQWRLLWALPLVPFYALLVSVAAWWALLDWILSPFHWHKTEHGFARSSARGQVLRDKNRPDKAVQPLSAASANPQPSFAAPGRD